MAAPAARDASAPPDDTLTANHPPRLIDSSGEEGSSATQKGTRKKKKTKAKNASTSPEDGSVEAKRRGPRFEWRNHKPAQAYMFTLLEEYAASKTEEEKNTKRELALAHLQKTWELGLTDGEMRTKVEVWFKNRMQEITQGTRKLGDHSARLKRAAMSNADDADDESDEDEDMAAVLHAVAKHIAPLLRKMKGRARAATVLWADDHPGVIEESREKDGIGDWRTTVHKLWEALPADEQEEYRRQAREAKAARERGDEWFENQPYFPRLAAALLSLFPGFERGKVGACIMYLMIATRDVHGEVHNHRYTIGVRKNAPLFNVFEGGPAPDERDRWSRYVVQQLEPNPISRDPRLVYSGGSAPKLPDFENSWTHDFIASILDAFFRAIWQLVCNDTTAELDWVAVASEPARFLPPAWLECGISDPTKIGLLKLALLYDKLLTAQNTADPFRFLPPSSASTPSNACLTVSIMLPEPKLTASRPSSPIRPSSPSTEPTVRSALPLPVPSPAVASDEPQPAGPSTAVDATATDDNSKQSAPQADEELAVPEEPSVEVPQSVEPAVAPMAPEPQQAVEQPMVVDAVDGPRRSTRTRVAPRAPDEDVVLGKRTRQPTANETEKAANKKPKPNAPGRAAKGQTAPKKKKGGRN
ncbi:hypothetical protein K466DRAFT_604562 [Polyporus arcularius HHB13444]|uniref:Uncharacterized protein n=1 Tax=Polyporus arcularius HHB13444 TaxID=1314778 RepID=A0A5C3NYE0_9APHY|nr:hypothetical protein K466DRAFT_604562 [Polyporus arcularius HHB13444]